MWIGNLGNFLVVAPQILSPLPAPSKSVQKSQYQYQSTRGTLANEALYFSTFYPNSRDMGTAD